MSKLLITTVGYRYQDARQLRISLNSGAVVVAEACHESWMQSGGTVEELQVTMPFVEAHNDWLHGGELPFAKVSQDKKDLLSLAHTYLDTIRCKGGRLVNRRYCCSHCGSFDPQNECDGDK